MAQPPCQLCLQFCLGSGQMACFSGKGQAEHRHARPVTSDGAGGVDGNLQPGAGFRGGYCQIKF